MLLNKDNMQEHDEQLVWWVVNDSIARVKLGVPDEIWKRAEPHLLIKKSDMVRMFEWDEKNMKLYTDFEEAVEKVREMLKNEKQEEKKNEENK